MHQTVRKLLQTFFEKNKWNTTNMFKFKKGDGTVVFLSYATLAEELKNPESEMTRNIMCYVSKLDELITMVKSENQKPMEKEIKEGNHD
jgi:hypothetical protein